ncbi:serine/threonine protein kinase, partial [Streptomyces hyaluromycini]
RRVGEAEGSATPGNRTDNRAGNPLGTPPGNSPGTPGGSPGSGVSGGSAGSGAVAVGGIGSVGGAAGGTGGAQRAPGAPEADPEAARRAAIQARVAGGLPGAGPDEGPGGSGPAGSAPGGAGTGAVERRALETGADIRAARAGAIAAYRAGARAAARVQEAQQNGRAALPGARPPAEGETAAPAPQPPYGPGGPGHANGAAQQPYANGAAQPPYANGQAQAPGGEQQGAGVPPGRIADPYGVGGAPSPWHGAAPRPGAPPVAAPGQERTVLPAAGPGAGTPLTGTGATAPRTGVELQGVQGQPHVVVPAQGTGPAARWGEPAAVVPGRRGPATALAAERARQVRMTVVGPVTERWAPEQAVPVHENWQLAAPIGPATDLWALGALLFRAVQGHAPYPEESTAELVQLVCSEPPAFAEECGSLRPVVESLLRQDPIERLDFEELRGWLRSLVRSAPEPDAGTYVVAAPPADPKRLPIIRRRGELVRRRRAGLPATHGRHKRARQEAKSPRRLGRTLLLLVLLLLAAAVAYAMLFLPKKGSADDGTASGDRTGAAGEASPAPGRSAKPTPTPTPTPTSTPSTETQTTAGSTGGAEVADGFTLRDDPNGFRIAVAKGWSRTPRNGSGQVIYSHGKFELIVVAGRDSAASYGSDPMTYQRDKEPELQPYRDSSWATAGGLRTITVGQQVSAEGQFTWTDSQAGDLFVRNMVFLINGRYHIVQVRGPEADRDEVTTLYEQASSTYKYTG